MSKKNDDSIGVIVIIHTSIISSVFLQRQVYLEKYGILPQIPSLELAIVLWDYIIISGIAQMASEKTRNYLKICLLESVF